jgi:hypothetical protein
MEYTIKLSPNQLQAIIDVINTAPVARNITDPIMINLENQIKLQENGSTDKSMATDRGSGNSKQEASEPGNADPGRAD